VFHSHQQNSFPKKKKKMNSPNQPSNRHHPTMTKIVFLNVIFKFMPFSNITNITVLRRFFELASTHSSWRETLLHYNCPHRIFLGFNTQIGNSALQPIANLTSLQVLDVRNTILTDRALEEVARLKNLTTLVLLNVYISDAGLQHLAGLSNLQQLALGKTQISDSGLQHLVNLNKLETLHLNSTTIGDSGLQHLSNLISLKTLVLYFTQISDAGLQHLAKLVHLQELQLQHTQISDVGLQHLVHLPNLDGTKVFTGNTQVTEKGLEEFKKQLLENQAKQKS
jgi:Leucine-rich repeat (LRR) protein